MLQWDFFLLTRMIKDLEILLELFWFRWRQVEEINHTGNSKM